MQATCHVVQTTTNGVHANNHISLTDSKTSSNPHNLSTGMESVKIGMNILEKLEIENS